MHAAHAAAHIHQHYLAASELDLLRRVALSTRAVQARMVFDDGFEPASIAAIIREVIGTTSPLTINTRRVFVARLSAGGAMAAILAATYLDLFAAVAVHSGLRTAPPRAWAAFAAMAHGGEDPAGQGRAAHAAMGAFARPVPSVVVHGNADRTVAPANADQGLEQWMTANRLAAPETATSISRAPPPPGGARSTAATPTRTPDGPTAAAMHELLKVDGLGHAWSGGAPGGSYTDRRAPDATEVIWRFFTEASADDPAG